MKEHQFHHGSWIHLIMDACIGAFLAVFFHHLAHKQNVKLKKIINEHDAMKKRRVCNSYYYCSIPGSDHYC